MARARRIAPDTPVVPTVSPEVHARNFVAITFEHIVDATPALKFYSAKGEVLIVGLTLDAERIWRRGQR